MIILKITSLSMRVKVYIYWHVHTRKWEKKFQKSDFQFIKRDPKSINLPFKDKSMYNITLEFCTP